MFLKLTYMKLVIHLSEPIVKVSEADPRDVGRGIVRIDPKITSDLKLNPGDAIEIIGKRKTFALLLESSDADYGKGIIKMDGYLRRNSQVSIDDKVLIRKTDIKIANTVLLTPKKPLRIIGGEEYLKQILHGRIVTLNDFLTINIMGRVIDLIITGFKPKGDAVIVSDLTNIIISEKSIETNNKNNNLSRISYEDLGGIKNHVQKIREMIELPLRHPELFERLNIEAPKGVLLHGPPGTGKTLLAKAVANETNAEFISISGPEIMSKFYGESENKLREIFEKAEKFSPSIIFIDEIDSIAPKREEVSGEVEKRIVSQLLSLMDGLNSRGKVVVIGATNRPNSIDSALRRPGRFDREIEIGIPDKFGRYEILQIHTRGMPIKNNVNLKDIANITHGFVGADLFALCKEAAIRSIRKIIPKIDLNSQNIPASILNTIEVSQSDFHEALRDVTPSALREIFVDVPSVKWDAIGGLEKIKEELKESIELPLKYDNLFNYVDMNSIKGILLYGSPGTGKTLLAKAVATESEANFISVKGPELLSKYVGESEKAIREIFRKAKQSAPSVIFFDELDSIAQIRNETDSDSHVGERVLSQLLTELDGIEELKDIVVIGATNRLDMIDQALIRPGRFDKLIEVPLPGNVEREKIFDIYIKNKPLSNDVNIHQLSEMSEGLNGAFISTICSIATVDAIKDFVNIYPSKTSSETNKNQLKLTMKNFLFAFKKLKIQIVSKKQINNRTKLQNQDFIA